jgi:hypothetical protein
MMLINFHFLHLHGLVAASRWNQTKKKCNDVVAHAKVEYGWMIDDVEDDDTAAVSSWVVILYEEHLYRVFDVEEA